jgi:hypothetical protein
MPEADHPAYPRPLPPRLQIALGSTKRREVVRCLPIRSGVGRLMAARSCISAARLGYAEE